MVCKSADLCWSLESMGPATDFDLNRPCEVWPCIGIGQSCRDAVAMVDVVAL